MTTVRYSEESYKLLPNLPKREWLTLTKGIRESDLEKVAIHMILKDE
jgi:hypothetical protein